MERFKKLIEDYGTIALVTYFAIFFLVWIAFGVAIAGGVTINGAAASDEIVSHLPDFLRRLSPSLLRTVVVVIGSYGATKLTQPIRILVTLGLTPIVARVYHRIRPPKDTPSASPPTA